MGNLVDQLHIIAVAVMKNSSINVIIDNRLDTAMTDFKNIYVTDRLMPPELRKLRRVKGRIFDGEVAHEAGHIVITAPVKQALIKWVEHQPNRSLANLVHQALEDKRVNHFIMMRYRFDLARRLQLLADVSNRLWVDTLKLQLQQMRASNPANLMAAEEKFVENILIPLSVLKGLWNWDVVKDFVMSDEQKEFVRKTTVIFDEARFDKMPMSVLSRHDQLYRLWEERVEKSGDKSPEGHCPKGIGGTLVLVSGQETRKALKDMEKALQAQEEKAKAQAEKDGKRHKKGDDEDNTMAIGSGSGLNIPTPTPNEAEYNRIVARNREHIEKLLNLLKRLAKPKLVTDKWRRQGRFMTEVLGQAYVSSKHRQVQDIYASRSLQMEKAEACLGLIVDLSGSVSEDDAKDSLTVVSEVCGRWLKDEDFGIMVFGSDYQKIKAFVEPYHTTRLRIGGVKCLGGTELYEPLSELYKMMKAQHDHRAKILMIVSDFAVDRDEDCKKLIKQIEGNDINVVGLGIDSTNEPYIKQFCKNGKYIGNIKELPEAVFDLYRKVAF